MNNIFTTLIFCIAIFSCNAQQRIEPESISWDKLKELQYDIASDVHENYMLSPQCFLDIKSYKFMPKQTVLQTILWNTYMWDKYLMPDGLYCIVLVDNISAETKTYQVLDKFESKVLLSASNREGFKEKGIFDYVNAINSLNLRMSNKKDVNKSYSDTDNSFAGQPVFSIDNFIFSEQGIMIKLPQNNDIIKLKPNKTLLGLSKNRIGITHTEIETYPYYNLADIVVDKNNCGTKSATGFLLSDKVVITNAHVLYDSDCGQSSQYGYFSASHLHGNNLISHYYFQNGNNIRFTNEWFIGGASPRSADPNDLGAIRFNLGFYAPVYMKIITYRDFSVGENVSMIGYPSTQNNSGNFGMWEYSGVTLPDINALSDSQVPIDVSPTDLFPGQSGSPAFEYGSDFSFGIYTAKFTDSTSKGVVNGFTERQFEYIANWLDWNPTTTIDFIQNPVNGGTYNLTNVPSFEVIVATINKMKLDGTIIERGADLNALVEWESSLDGSFANGATVSSDQLKANLSGGVHFITTKIDSNGEQGEASVYIEIIRPTGQFTSSNYCIVDIANSPKNTCSLNIKWSVTDTPETSVVWNASANSQFATGNSGKKSFTAKTSNTKFELYPSSQRKILLDTTNVSAKLPTGNLTNNTSVCSLQPTPRDPITGQLRDPKATPPGCGAQLSWSNVKWASPSIFYKFVGSNTWNYLYQIPCKLNGRVCSGSINTDDVLPELAPINGVQFKLLQFNSSSSGLLSPATSITAGHRYADAYEFDDGEFKPLGMSYAMTGLFSTEAELGVMQNNHNFHRDIDIDTLQVSVLTDLFPEGFNDGKILSLTISNMINGLDIGIEIKCIGKSQAYIDGSTDQTEPVPGAFEFVNKPIESIVVDPITGDKTMTFRVTDETIDDNSDGVFIVPCIKNQIELTRLSGIPSENLTYSVVVNDPANVASPPVLNTAKSIWQNNYGIQLLGSNFDATASVQVRENVNGSGIIETYSGNDIYNRTPLNGEERIQFPIRNLSQQDKFNNNGLCFKVINSDSTSIEKCFVRPVTADLPPFMGQVVESYNTEQDKEYTSYVVAGDARNKLRIWGNVWKKIASDYTVTPSTMLKFKFKSTHQQAKTNGIGFIMNGATTVSSSRTWQVYGTGTNFGKQDFHDYVSSGRTAQWKEYIIPIGETFTGKLSQMVFIADEDVHVGQHVVYKNPVLYEAPDQYDDVPNSRAYSDDYEGDAVGLLNGTTQTHNFHDSGDQDWTMVWSSSVNTIKVDIEMVGGESDTSLYVYKVTSADRNPAYPDQNRYIINGMQLVASDTSIGSSSVIFTTEVNYLYVMKTVSRNASFGPDTEYKISLNIFNEDEYDNVSIRGYSDDYEGDAVGLLNGTTQTHNFHDSGDQDWTMVWSSSVNTIKVDIEMVGSESDTSLYVYKVTSADRNPAYPDQNRYIINGMQLVASDTSIGSSSAIFTTEVNYLYVMKTVSRNASFGFGTEYKINLNIFNEDEYDNVFIRGYSDDYEGDAAGLLNGTTQSHNFHDFGDQDWTMVWSSSVNTINVDIEMVGSESDTSLYVYKVTNADRNPAYPDQNRYIINNMQLVASDTSVGNSSVVFTTEVNYLYVMKAVSRNASYGPNTEYRIKLNRYNEDEYDDVSIRGYSDDYEGDAVALINATTQSHNFHDSSDQDWTMIWSSSVKTINVSTQMLGNKSDTLLYIYKVTDIILNTDFPDQNRYIINNMQLVGSDTSTGNSSVNFTTEVNYLYVIQTKSRNNSFGVGTEYNISLNIQ